MFCYKDGKSIIRAFYYKSSKSIMINLIIIKIKFIYFQKDEVFWSCVKAYSKSRNYRFCDHGVIQ